MGSPGEQRLSAIQGFPASSHRLSAATGVIAVLLFGAGFAILGTDFPTYDDSPRHYAAWYADHTNDVQLSNLLLLFGMAAFVWFVAFLRWSYSAAEQVARGFQRAAPLAFGAGIAGAAIAAVYIPAHEAAVVSQGISLPGTVRAFDLFGAYALLASAVFLSIFLLASFFLIRVTNVLPQWLGWVAGLGSVLGVVQAVLLLAPENDDGLLGLLGFVWFGVFLVWTLGASLVLVRRTA